MSGPKGAIDAKPDLERVVAFIIKERRRRSFDAIRSLWRIGDSLRQLKAITSKGNWRRVLEECATRVGMHSASLHEAARTAEAFGAAERGTLRRRFERARAELTPSHVVELARASVRQRARGIEALLRRTYSTRELRTFLRGRAS